MLSLYEYIFTQKWFKSIFVDEIKVNCCNYMYHHLYMYVLNRI